MVMYRTIRAHISKLLIVVFGFQLLMPLLFLLSLNIIRHDQQKILKHFSQSNNDFEQLFIPKKDIKYIHWITNDEISYLHQMYDVADIQDVDDGLILSVVSDNKEQKLLNEQEKQEQQKDFLSLTLKFLSIQLYLEPAKETSTINKDFKSHSWLSTYLLKAYKDPFIQVHLPPPDFQLV